MRIAWSLGSALGLALATLAATPQPTVESALGGEAALQLYTDALAAARTPPAISFTYSVEQLGLVNLLQTHRVFRQGNSERDETIVVDGYRLKQPSVRILAGRVDRYDLARIAPKPKDYAFTFNGAINTSGSGYTYVFSTTPHVSTGFAVTSIELDGHTFLPRTIHFKIAGGSAHGSGEMSYGPVDRYWVVLAADVSAHVAGGGIAHEALRWSDYHFPASLPQATFVLPQPAPVDTGVLAPGPL